MTPEVLLSVTGASVQGRWGGREVSTRADVQVWSDAVLLDQVRIPWRALSDATLAREALVLHRKPEHLTLAGPGDWPRVWGTVVQQACAVPEVTRGLSALRPVSGVAGEWQSRFLSPLLSARKRIEEPDTLERRVMHVDAAEVWRRVQLVIAQSAQEAYPEDAPRRRALEAHLEEAVEGLDRRLGDLGRAAEHLLSAPDGTRFLAWRGWTHALRGVFVEADRAWHTMRPLLSHR